ncbi:hypothetical protein LCGC14_2707800 [marine sediment metagenome]|uniref:Uncharacterized protein n=1 Tax=marine sediment metagenome TaxID=412755 RepID=A0A0F9BMX2_9ZZZZ
MNKEVELLARKYFWQQKIKEVSLFLIITLSIILIPYLLGHNIGDNKDEMCSFEVDADGECHIIMQWFEGIIYLIFIGLVLLAGAVILVIFLEWIDDNWIKAKKKAYKEYRKTKSKEKKDG